MRNETDILRCTPRDNEIRRHSTFSLYERNTYVERNTRSRVGDLRFFFFYGKEQNESHGVWRLRMIYSRAKRNPVAGGIARLRKGVEPRRGLQPSRPRDQLDFPLCAARISEYTRHRVARTYIHTYMHTCDPS